MIARLKYVLNNPVMMKELRGRMRGNRAMIILTTYLFLAGVVTMLVYLAFYTSNVDPTSPSFEDSTAIGKTIFITVVTVTMLEISIITQSLTAGSITGEKERQSYDLLITTLMSPTRIILGKLIAAVGFALLLVISVLPLAGLAFLFGGVSATELSIAIVGLMVTVLLYASIGIFWSTVMRSTISATVLAQATILVPLIGIPFLFVIGVSFLENVSNFDKMMNIPLFIYFFGTLLCVHPFIALGLTEAALYAGKNPFFFTIEPYSREILVPSPWLIYVFISLLLTTMFLVLSVRMLRPARVAGMPRARRRSSPTSPNEDS